jgi:hypothetical protein
MQAKFVIGQANDPQAALPRLSASPPRIQPKLEIGAVDDPLEREANAVADAVMRMPDPALAVSAAPAQVSRKCAECEEEDKKLQMKPAAVPQAAGVDAPPIVEEVLRGLGQPLDAGTRAFFEPRFGCDFSGVRVHADDRAAEAARSIGASAYTAGSNIAFARGQFDPATSGGRRLIAHELTHVVQQRSQRARVQRDINSDDYKQGYQDGLSGIEPQPGPRASDALTDYNEGYAKGHYEFGLLSSSGAAASTAPTPTAPTPTQDTGPAPVPAPLETAPPPTAPAPAVSADYQQGYQDGVSGGDPQPGPRASDALTDYNEGYAKGHYEFGQQSSSGAARSPSATEMQAPTPETPASVDSTVQPPGPVSCTPPANCPSEFCTPLPWLIAQNGRLDTFATILGGIAAVVSPRVVPLWSQYIWGGVATVQDLSAQFGPDFSINALTISITDFLVDAMKSDLQANPPTFPLGENTVQLTIDPKFGPQTAAALDAIRRPGDPHAMEFTGNSIPGNLAGGIGLNEAACKVGAIPSSQDDDRRATGTVKVTQFPHIATLLVDPSINYAVVDTIDLCPGNCGTGFLTVKTTTILSRWEATGISGDVPFIVNFPAPTTAPFIVTLTSSAQRITP